MHYNTNTFTASDGETICYYKWDHTLDTPCRGIVQIAHGIGEYGGRYDHIANRFQQEGFVVYANDHRAHGRTAAIKKMYGHYTGNDYFKDVVCDMNSLFQLAQVEYPDTRCILFGHSMGSLLSRQYVLTHGKEIDALILSGTANFIIGLGHFGLVATKALTTLRGRERGNEKLRALLFDQLNKKFKPNRTKLDWLSRDESQVDAFESDPYRIENFSMGLLADLISYTQKLNKRQAFVKTPDELPLLIFSGDQDPVGEMGSGVKKVVKHFKNNGNSDLTFHLYEGGRHEMLNELNSHEVEEDIVTWLNIKIPS